MADPLVSALVNPILRELTSLALEEVGLAWGLQTELENLKSTLSTIQTVLQDAEEKQWKSASVKNWLRKLKDAAYDAEDVIDEFKIEAQMCGQAQRRGQQRAIKSQLRAFFSINQNPLGLRLIMAHKLKKVTEKLDAIAKERHNFHLTVGTMDTEADSFDWRQTWSLVNESEVYGREQEKEELINSLVNSSGHLSVYAICGMGGLGKTTLAQLIYNEGRVKRHFDLTIWVCVSDDSTVTRLTKAIIESIEKGSCDVKEMDTLQQRLREKLTGKKLLLVLDDVWDDFHDKWSSLKDLLRCGAKGSAVLITTRIEIVALSMEPVLSQLMGRLSDDDSWLLFKQFAFELRNREDIANLENIGREIVKKCGGVPLAIKALGKLMCLKKKESEWLSIKESEIWDLQEEEKEILPALRLSYSNLPPNLKQCFAFCSIFPKDHILEKDQLIALWMANGFISSKGRMDLHDKGHEIFSQLVGRSFFQEVEEDEQGYVTCKMHDLMHDLARSIMIHECSSVERNNKAKISKTVRHVAFWNGYDACSGPIHFNAHNSLRSFFLHRPSYCSEKGSEILHLCFSKQKHLRVLNVSKFYDVQKVPRSISNLKHLSHLDLSGCLMKTLPECTVSLQNLQTLNLRDCWRLKQLPKDMKHMRSLIYLDITGCRSLLRMPAGMGQLTSLRKLSLFIVDKDGGHQIRELGRLNYLGNELSIIDLGKVNDLTDARSANLMGKTTLFSLSLSWHGNGGYLRADSTDRVKRKSSVVQKNIQEVLDGLQPHPNLKKLRIIGYGGSIFPNWMMDLMLPNLVEISLEWCGNCEQLPPFWKLQFLKHLGLYGMNAVKCIGSDVYGDGENSFPSLETLRFHSMNSLEKWESVTGRQSFPPRLQKLYVAHCPVLVEIPIIPSVRTLEIEESSVALLRSVQKFTSLNSLVITGMPNLMLLPDGLLQNHTMLEHLVISGMKRLQSLSNQIFDNLSALKSLYIRSCDVLDSLPESLRSLHSLEKLDIWRCHRLNSLPVNILCGLSSLRNLDISNCKEFASLSEGVQYLKALEHLKLDECPELNSLPESIQHLTSLRYLTISSCKRLSSLPNQIQYLTSLLELVIWICPNLNSLPDGLRSLNTLRRLDIGGCPNLERRCEKERGEDWSKIAHIPYIKINWKVIQESSD